MARSRIRVEFVNFNKLRKTLKSRALLHYIVWPAIESTTAEMLKQMRQTSPYWKGKLRRSLGVRNDKRNLSAEVGHTKALPNYAEYMEYGTGIFRLDEDYNSSPRQAYWPPGIYLAEWATSKGLNPYAVAAGIKKRGGLLPRKYVKSGADAGQYHIDHRLPSYFNSIPDFLVI